jgi:hypothetical protein
VCGHGCKAVSLRWALCPVHMTVGQLLTHPCVQLYIHNQSTHSTLHARTNSSPAHSYKYCYVAAVRIVVHDERALGRRVQLDRPALCPLYVRSFTQARGHSCAPLTCAFTLPSEPRRLHVMSQHEAMSSARRRRRRGHQTDDVARHARHRKHRVWRASRHVPDHDPDDIVTRQHFWSV